MTGPRGTVGEVRADLVIDTDKTEESLRDGLDDVRDAVDDDLKDIGDVWGETLADSMGDKLSDSAPNVASSFGRALDRERVVTKMTVQYDADGNVMRRWVTTVAKQLEKAVKDEGDLPGGGVFKQIGTAIGDAVGAGFNVPGRSPLIALLIPAVGYIVALVVGAIQALNGLAAVILALPGAIAGLLIQVGILMIAFQGVGTAIQGAFAATNAEELDKALEGLTYSAQLFVKELLPLKPIFSELKRILQETFFSGFLFMEGSPFGTSIDRLGKLLSDPALLGALGKVAYDLGRAADILVGSLSSPEVKTFLMTILPKMGPWVVLFADAVSSLIAGFARLATTMQPFLDWLGREGNAAIAKFANWLVQISEDPEFLRWLERAKGTLQNLFYFLGQAVNLIFVIFKRLDEAGGSDFLRTLGDQLAFLSDWFDRPEGAKALEGLITILEMLSWAFIIMVMAVWALLFVFQIMSDFIWGWLVPTIGELLKFLFELLKWFLGIGGELENFRNTVATVFAAVAQSIVAYLSYAMAFIGTLPTFVMNAFSNIGSMMFNIGRNIVQGLINGMLAMLGPLGAALYVIGGKISAYLPHSPAKEGPLSGSGDPLKAGQTIVDRLATGMEMQSPRLEDASSNAVSNIVFGAGAIQNTFYGQPPSQNQATGIGAGIGNGISGILAQRDTRLTVRAMA